MSEFLALQANIGRAIIRLILIRIIVKVRDWDGPAEGSQLGLVKADFRVAANTVNWTTAMIGFPGCTSLTTPIIATELRFPAAIAPDVCETCRFPRCPR